MINNILSHASTPQVLFHDLLTRFAKSITSVSCPIVKIEGISSLIPPNNQNQVAVCILILSNKGLARLFFCHFESNSALSFRFSVVRLANTCIWLLSSTDRQDTALEEKTSGVKVQQLWRDYRYVSSMWLCVLTKEQYLQCLIKKVNWHLEINHSRINYCLGIPRMF